MNMSYNGLIKPLINVCHNLPGKIKQGACASCTMTLHVNTSIQGLYLPHFMSSVCGYRPARWPDRGRLMLSLQGLTLSV